MALNGETTGGTAHANNVASRELLYCAASSGAHFDRRAQDMKQHDDVVEGIIANA